MPPWPPISWRSDVLQDMRLLNSVMFAEGVVMSAYPRVSPRRSRS